MRGSDLKSDGASESAFPTSPATTSAGGAVDAGGACVSPGTPATRNAARNEESLNACAAIVSPSVPAQASLRRSCLLYCGTEIESNRLSNRLTLIYAMSVL